MLPFDSYLFWEEDYKPLENEFLNYIKYVPLTEEHKSVWSLKLANQLLLIGSSIDSFFKSAKLSLKKSLIDNHIKKGNYYVTGYTYEDFEEESNFYKNLLSEESNMGFHRKFFEDYYKLSDKSVYVLKSKEKLEPFKEWANDKSPEWWKIYRDLKHNRFSNKESATLEIALNALAALFLLNIYHLENREYLANVGVIRSNMNLNRNFRDFLNSKEINTMMPIIAKTKVFGYVYSGYKDYPWVILDPGNVYGL